jgi:hypothetical protein
MRTALTIALPHEGTGQELLAGVDVPIDTQIRAIKQLSASREHPEFREVQLWIADTGISKRVKFKVPAEPSPADPSAKRSKKTK